MRICLERDQVEGLCCVLHACRYVSVGNEPYLSKIQPSDDYLMLAVSRMQVGVWKLLFTASVEATLLVQALGCGRRQSCALF